MKASDYLKEFERKRGEQPEKDHTLRENAMERAKHPGEMHAGTAFDWEDVGDYEKELERMESKDGKLYPSRKDREEAADSEKGGDSLKGN